MAYYDIRWIPFDEFKNIEYLIKSCFGEVLKATLINCYYDREVVLKRIYIYNIYNSSDKIVNIFITFKWKFYVMNLKGSIIVIINF